MARSSLPLGNSSRASTAHQAAIINTSVSQWTMRMNVSHCPFSAVAMVDSSDTGCTDPIPLSLTLAYLLRNRKDAGVIFAGANSPDHLHRLLAPVPVTAVIRAGAEAVVRPVVLVRAPTDDLFQSPHHHFQDRLLVRRQHFLGRALKMDVVIAVVLVVRRISKKYHRLEALDDLGDKPRHQYRVAKEMGARIAATTGLVVSKNAEGATARQRIHGHTYAARIGRHQLAASALARGLDGRIQGTAFGGLVHDHRRGNLANHQHRHFPGRLVQRQDHHRALTAHCLAGLVIPVDRTYPREYFLFGPQ